jgi:uncharacterized repeat protein (TIGR01451 family)
MTGTTPIILGIFRACSVLANLMIAMTAMSQSGLDHFEWEPISSFQQLGNPIVVGITARDRSDNLVANFSGSVSITGLQQMPPTILITEIDTGTSDKIEITNLSDEQRDVSGWELTLYDSTSYPLPKVTFVVPAGTLCPARTPFQIRAGGTFPGTFPTFFLGISLSWSFSASGNQIAALLRDPTGRVVDYFCAAAAHPAAITNPISIPGSEWLGLPAFANTDSAKTYQRIGNRDHNGAIDWINATNSVGLLNTNLRMPFTGTYASIPINPVSAIVTNGEWTGNITISNATAGMFLRADDLNGHPGDSSLFAVLNGLPLRVQIPGDAYETAAGPLLGNVSINEPLPTNLVVNLTSTSPVEVSIASTATIIAGTTNVFFNLTNFDDALLDGLQIVTIGANAEGFVPATAVIKNHDDESALLTVTLPSTVQENAKTLTGAGLISVATPVAGHFIITLSSSRPAEIQVPSTVLLPAGQTSTAFNLTVFDDNKLNGPRQVVITASTSGWISGQNQTVIIDNETNNLSLAMPLNVMEGNGILTNASVKIFGVPSTNVMVLLSSGKPSKLQVPAPVVIPAGQTSAVFSVTIPDDSLTDGTQIVPVSATASGFATNTVNVTVKDNDLHHFGFAPVPNPEAIGRSFIITIYAADTNGVTITNYNGAAALSGTSASGPITLQGTNAIQFTNGVWMGSVAVASETKGVTLVADDANGHAGTSNPFEVWSRVLALPTSDIIYDPLAQKLYAGVLASYGTNGQSVISINPQTGQLGSPIFIQNEPGRLALSDNGQFLYAAQNSTGGVARINLASQAVDFRFSLGSDSYGQFYAEDLEVLPGNATALAVARVSWDRQGIAIYDNGVVRTNVASSLQWNTVQRLEVADNAGFLFAIYDRAVRKMAINTAGLIDLALISDARYSGELEFANGRLYCTTGHVLGTNNFELLSQFPAQGLVEPLITENRVYFLTENGTNWQLRVFDINISSNLGTWDIPFVTGTPLNLLACGNNTLALATSSEVILFHTTAIPIADIAVSQVVSPDAGILGSNLMYTITVSNRGPDNAEAVVVTNTLISGLNFISSTSSQGTSSYQNGIITTFLGMLPNGSQATITMIATPKAPGVAINSIVVDTKALDLNRTNNSLIRNISIPTSATTNAIIRLNLPTRDLIYDPVTRKIFASVPETAGDIANSLIEIDPETLTIGPAHFVGSKPTKLTMVRNGRHIYVALDGEAGIRSFDTVSGIAGSAFSIGAGQKVVDLEVLPGTTNSLIVSKYATGNDDYVGNIYDNGIPRANPLGSVGYLEPASDASKAYGILFNSGGTGFLNLNVTSNGLVLSNQVAFDSSYYGDIESENGLIYFHKGGVLDPASGTFLPRFPSIYFDSLVLPDSSSGKAFFIYSANYLWYFQEHDLQSRAILKTIQMPVLGGPSSLIRCGSNSVAFRTAADDVFIIRTGELPLLATAELTISQSVSPTIGTVGSNVIYYVVVTNAGPDAATGVTVSNALPRGATFVSATVSQGTFTNAGQNITFDVGTLNSGSAYFASIVARAGMAGFSTNTVSVSATQNDYFATNNQSILITTNVFSNAPFLFGQVSIGVRDILFDPVRLKLYASVSSTEANLSNSIVTIDPATGEITQPIAIGCEAYQLAISDNAQYLYLALSTGGVARLDLTSHLIDLRFPLVAGVFNYVADMQVLPGKPGSLAVSVGSHTKVAIYDNGIERPEVVGPESFGGTYYIAFSNPTNMYSTYPFRLRTIAVETNGVRLISDVPNLVPGYEAAFEYDSGLIFFLNGRVVNPSNQTIIGTFPAGGLLVPDVGNQIVYILTQTGDVWSGPLLSLRGFNANTFAELWAIKFPSGLGSATRMISMGTNGLAICTDSNRLVFVHPSELSPVSADLAVSGSANVSTISVGGTLNYSFTVMNNGYWTASGVTLTNPLPAGSSFISASSTQGAWSQSNGVVSCSLGSITNGGSVIVTVSIVVTNLGLMTNSAIVTATTTDPTLTNNSVSLVTTVNPLPLLSISDVAVQEGNSVSSVSFAVRLTPASSQTVKVQFRARDGTAIGGRDYSTNAGISGTLTFNPGTTNLSIFLSGGLIGNTLVQSNRFFVMNLTNASNAVIAKAEGICWIVEDDFYQIAVASTSVIEGNGGVTNASFTLSLTPTNNQTVSVDYQTLTGTASAGIDYIPKAGTLVFNPGITNKSIAVAVFGDSLFETNETFFLTLFNPLPALINTNEVIGTILNDDTPPPLAIRAVSYNSGTITLGFDTVEGRVYRVQRSELLTPESWGSINEVVGTGALLEVSDTPPTNPPAFYRLVTP